MARVIVTPQARSEVEASIASLGLPGDTWQRIADSLRILEDFPLAGRALEGRWGGARFILGPWPWMVLLHVFVEERDAVYLVAVQDARSSTAATDRP